MTKKNWKPLREATVDRRDYTDSKYRHFVDVAMQQYGLDFEAACKRLKDYDDTCTYWRNDLYQVQVRRFRNEAFEQDMIHLNIRRIDGAPIFDWRHRQWIKNQLVGDECEGFELYPAESRMVDTSNKYHIWCFTDSTVRLPVNIDGYGKRDVVEQEVKSPPGARQRRM
jgi:hypothetical protein